MKAILKFNLPDDKIEYDLAVGGSDMFCALLEFERELRVIWKHEELNADEWQMVDRIRTEFYEILNNNKVSLDK
jgi:hypothetical protein